MRRAIQDGLKGVGLLAMALLAGCAAQPIPVEPEARYVWLCRLAGADACTGTQIRCWDTRAHDWADPEQCEQRHARPAQLLNRQSYPRVPPQALWPYVPR